MVNAGQHHHPFGGFGLLELLELEIPNFGPEKRWVSD